MQRIRRPIEHSAGKVFTKSSSLHHSLWLCVPQFPVVCQWVSSPGSISRSARSNGSCSPTVTRSALSEPSVPPSRCAPGQRARPAGRTSPSPRPPRLRAPLLSTQFYVIAPSCRSGTYDRSVFPTGRSARQKSRMYISHLAPIVLRPHYITFSSKMQ